MKNRIRIYSLLLMISILILTNSCKKDDNKAVPVLTTSAVGGISSVSGICDMNNSSDGSLSATCGGNISSDGGSKVTVCGVCWSTGSNPSLADNKTTDAILNIGGSEGFSSRISGLETNITYYVRAYATNSKGTGYGNVLSFNTLKNEILFNPDLSYGTVTDFDGNEYVTITIGTQTWMAENLKVTHYRNGDIIPNGTDDFAWEGTYNGTTTIGNVTTGQYCDQLNKPIYSKVYGRLYNWYAVNDNRNIAPTGWHVSSDAEWTILINYLGGDSIAGRKLKEIGLTHWKDYWEAAIATNETGFTALPGGGRVGGAFVCGFGQWWSSEKDASNAYYRNMGPTVNTVDRNSNYKWFGFSVRCIKD